jgi:Tfp pilus assembly protein PilN
VHQRHAYLAELAKQTAQVQDLAQGVAAKQKQLRLVRGHLDRSGGVLELLAKVAELAPPSGLNISRVVFKRGDSISIEGRTETKESVNQLADALRKAGAPNLEQTIGGMLKSTQERGKEVWQYELVSKFPVAESAENEPSEGTSGE